MIFVPNISPLKALKTQCLTLPSIIDTVPTPLFTDSTAVSNFGIIPPDIVPSATKLDNFPVNIVSISCLLLSNTPVTSVNRSSLSACEQL